MIDRFRGDTGAVLDPPATPGSRAGGTLDGVRTELVAGTFDALGVSALWLSPVYVNPIEARPGRFDDHLYEGYHGYWPLDSHGVEQRIGGPDALHALVAEAHARGIRVLLDLVPNHVYETNPRVAEHRAQGWFHEHDAPCVCGSPTCPWDTFIQTCWFTEYLPDIRFAHPDAMQTAIDDAIWWQTTFDTDGVRIDAVPMMPRAVTRRIVADLRRAHGTPDAAFTLGEIFTGGGETGTADIRYYMGPHGLDSAFDFPLMWALRDVIAHGRADFFAIEQSLQTTDAALADSGAIMARMIGNHDVTRFVTEIAGTPGADPWEAPASVPSDPAAYDRQALALGLVLTLPGLPVIYYGDEVGLAGGSDPDNRRVMPDLASLPDDRIRLLDRVRRIATARRCLPALRSDTRIPLVVAADVWAFVRDAGDGRPAIVLASRHDSPVTIELPSTAAFPNGSFVDVLDDERFALGTDAVQVAMPPRSLRVLVPDADPCL
jgi:glycosidase